MEGPDGNALFYTKRAEQSDLFRSELDGSGERLVLIGIARLVTKDRIYYLHPGADTSTSLNVFILQTGADTQCSKMLMFWQTPAKAPFPLYHTINRT